MKILTVFGTRPEAIKLYPVINELKAHGAECEVCSVGQQNQLLKIALAELEITPDYSLNLYKHAGDLHIKLGAVVSKVGDILKNKNIIL